jgi:hypothetical protein
MRTKIFLVITSIVMAILSSNRMIGAEEIPAVAMPTTVVPGGILSVLPASNRNFLSMLLDVQWDGVSIQSNLISNSRNQILLFVPSDALPGTHLVFLQFDDMYTAEVEVTVSVLPAWPDSTVDGLDPNPATQNGKAHNTGDDPTGVQPGSVVYNRPGGYGNYTVDCDSLHEIDGVFTDSVYSGLKEWNGIVPLKGRFSNLYLDYCQSRNTMYLLNDWYLCTTEMDSSSCYNRFDFSTGAGSEHWQIWVYHSRQRGMRVMRNGVDVSDDTTYVLSGRYGFGKSPLYDTAHTIYEFGIRVQSGLFFLPAQDDPYRPPTHAPSVETICDRDDIEGWGLVREPMMYGGELRQDSIIVRQYYRYIPLAGATGLVREPVAFGGVCEADSITVRSIGAGTTDEQHYRCSDIPHVIDGQFTIGEWNRTPAKGRYSNLYADYCNGILYIMNDWTLAVQEPHQQSCYNLFELFTGSGREHWGIFVYNDKNKGIRVFRNGVDVSADTAIVSGGAYGWGTSPLKGDSLHTLYEFGIRAEEGEWMLFLADPGPNSVCSSEVATDVYTDSSVGSSIEQVAIKTSLASTNDAEATVSFTLNENNNITFKIFDISGRLVFSSQPVFFRSGSHIHMISLQGISSGLYMLQLSTENQSVIEPFVMSR